MAVGHCWFHNSILPRFHVLRYLSIPWWGIKRGRLKSLIFTAATKLRQGNIFTSLCQEFCPQGGMHGRGACVVGGYVWQGGHAWQGACMVGGMHGREVCIAGGVHGRGTCMAGGHAWQGGMCGRGNVWWGGAWEGACMAGGCAWQENGDCSGQYASYWNAFLFVLFFQCLNYPDI